MVFDPELDNFGRFLTRRRRTSSQTASPSRCPEVLFQLRLPLTRKPTAYRFPSFCSLELVSAVRRCICFGDCFFQSSSIENTRCDVRLSQVNVRIGSSGSSPGCADSIWLTLLQNSSRPPAPTLTMCRKPWSSMRLSRQVESHESFHQTVVGTIFLSVALPVIRVSGRDGTEAIQFEPDSLSPTHRAHHRLYVS